MLTHHSLKLNMRADTDRRGTETRFKKPRFVSSPIATQTTGLPRWFVAKAARKKSDEQVETLVAASLCRDKSFHGRLALKHPDAL